jgi:hypothetical protein
MHRVAVFAVAVIVTMSCGKSPAAPGGTAIHVDAADPAGDAIQPPFGRVSPDLISAAVDVASGSITFVVGLAAGTLDPSSTEIFIYLDTDLNASTGARIESALGVDYWFDIINTQANVAKCQANFCPSVGTLAVTRVADTVTVTAPLALLGNDDGRCDVRVEARTIAVIRLDFMPDLNLSPTRVR